MAKDAGAVGAIAGELGGTRAGFMAGKEQGSIFGGRAAFDVGYNLGHENAKLASDVSSGQSIGSIAGSETGRIHGGRAGKEAGAMAAINESPEEEERNESEEKHGGQLCKTLDNCINDNADLGGSETNTLLEEDSNIVSE